MLHWYILASEILTEDQKRLLSCNRLEHHIPDFWQRFIKYILKSTGKCLFEVSDQRLMLYVKKKEVSFNLESLWSVMLMHLSNDILVCQRWLILHIADKKMPTLRSTLPSISAYYPDTFSLKVLAISPEDLDAFLYSRQFLLSTHNVEPS